MVASVPRTAWAVSWGVRTGMAYARCMAAHPVSDLGQMHFNAPSFSPFNVQLAESMACGCLCGSHIVNDGQMNALK